MLSFQSLVSFPSSLRVNTRSNSSSFNYFLRSRATDPSQITETVPATGTTLKHSIVIGPGDRPHSKKRRGSDASIISTISTSRRHISKKPRSISLDVHTFGLSSLRHFTTTAASSLTQGRQTSPSIPAGGTQQLRFRTSNPHLPLSPYRTHSSASHRTPTSSSGSGRSSLRNSFQ
jgi:hypothetical protein